ncbi:50S ribosomal protein L24 [Candidatus Uhrbacteria bacterium]|jgi:large subunit ribosomal protein L24|nr:50S ribosomal protein L24 [Candidatus Uhrbacteria bacterium]HJN85353.1 50S ribosomal protein L24 [Patescibacteria group bacterium]
MKIITGDNVKILAGKDRGKTGKVIQTFPEMGKVVVDKLNMTTKHLKGRGDQKGKKIEYPAPMNASNVAIVGKDGTGRVGYETVTKDDKTMKNRVLRKAGKSETI